MADKPNRTTVKEFVSESLHEIASHSSDAAQVHQMADDALKFGSAKIVNVRKVKNVSCQPFEEGGKWYYETRDLGGTITHGPFETKEDAARDMLE